MNARTTKLQGPEPVTRTPDQRDQLQIEQGPGEPRSPGERIEVSIVVPVYRSGPTLPELCHRISETMHSGGYRFEVLLIEDCGGDTTWSVCQALAETIPEVRAFRLRRNFGQHNALLCGTREASGATIVTLDDDLQNPPEEIPRLLEALDEGFDVVYGVPQRQETTAARRLSSIVAKRAIQQIGGFEAAPEVNSYRAFRADLARAFDGYRSPHVNIDVLLSWGTERYTSRIVRHEPRTVGQSGYSTFKLIRHALNMITGFSASPLKAASFVGFGTGMLGLLMMVYVLASYVLRDQTVPGFAFLASSVALFSGVQLFTIGILGEYLGRLYFGTMGKPDYVVAERWGGTHLAGVVEHRPQAPTATSHTRALAGPVGIDLLRESATESPARPGPVSKPIVVDESEPEPVINGLAADPSSAAVRRPSPLGWLMASVCMAIAGVAVLATSRELWFYADTWPMLAERSMNPGSWWQSHGGHLFIPATAMLQGLFETVGMAFYPWYLLPRVLLAAAGGLAWWRIARWRGVDPAASLLLALLYCWLGASGWVVTVSYSGPLLILLCAVVAGLMVEGWEPTNRPRLVLGAVLTLAVITSSGSGPAVWLATAIVLAVTGGLTRYLWSVAVPGTLYLSWYLLVARNDPNPITPGLPAPMDVVTAPVGMVPHIGAAVAALFGLSPSWSMPGAFVLFAAVVALAWLRLLGRFEVTLLVTGVIIAGLGVVVRQAQGIEVNAPNRLHLLLIYLVFPVLVAGLRGLPRDFRRLTFVGLGALVLLNVVLLLGEVDHRERIRAGDREDVETAAALLAQGEPAIGWTSVSPQAHHRHLQVLVDRGWQGELHPESVPRVLLSMKTGLFAVEEPFGVAPSTDSLAVGLNGCAPLPADEQRLRINGQGAVVLHGGAGSTIDIGWEEGGVRSFAERELTEAAQGLAYTHPKSADPAYLLIGGSWDSGSVSICGLAVGP